MEHKRSRTVEKRKGVFVFFPSIGNIGGAERRLVRALSQVKICGERVNLTVGLLLLNKVDENKLISSYRELTDANIVLYYSVKKVFLDVLKRKDFCICYTDCGFRCLPALFGALLSRKKRLLFCVDSIGSSHQLKPSARQMLYDFDVNFASSIDCLYPSSTQLLVARYRRKQITTTPGSIIDTERYRSVYPKQKQIVYLGRLKETKGIGLFVETIITNADKIRKNGYTCPIYGSGPMEEEIRKKIESNHCEDILILKGLISDSESALSISTVFCSLQKYGNYPSQALLEAQACGNYCIVTDTGDSRMIVEHGRGKLINDDSESLWNAIEFAMNMSAEDQKLVAEKAREYIQKNHTIERSVAYYTELISSLYNKDDSRCRK